MTIAAILADKGGEVSTIAAGATVREAVELLAARRIGALPLPLDDPRLVGATAAGGGVQLLASHLERSPRLLLETYLVTLAVNCGRGQGTVPAPQAPARRRQQ